MQLSPVQNSLRALQSICTPKRTIEPCDKKFRFRRATEPDSQAKFIQKQAEIAGKGPENDQKTAFLHAFPAAQFFYLIENKVEFDLLGLKMSAPHPPYLL